MCVVFIVTGIDAGYCYRCRLVWSVCLSVSSPHPAEILGQNEMTFGGAIIWSHVKLLDRGLGTSTGMKNWVLESLVKMCIKVAAKPTWALQ